MKILFDNVLINGTYSADNASANYPADNLVHAFLHKRYQHLAKVYDTVEITLPSTERINCFFLGYSNVGKIIVRFYDASSSLLLTKTLYGEQNVRYTTEGDRRETTGGDIRVTQDAFGDNSDAVHFSDIYVKKIEIDVYGGAGGYLGGVAAGVSEDFGVPVSPWTEPYIDNSIVTSSLYGQTLQQQIDPLRSYTWMLRDLTRSEINYIREIYYKYGYGARIWIDPFESDHDFMKPFYGRLNAPPMITKNGRRYDIEWEFREAR